MMNPNMNFSQQQTAPQTPQPPQSAFNPIQPQMRQQGCPPSTTPNPLLQPPPQPPMLSSSSALSRSPPVLNQPPQPQQQTQSPSPHFGQLAQNAQTAVAKSAVSRPAMPWQYQTALNPALNRPPPMGAPQQQQQQPPQHAMNGQMGYPQAGGGPPIMYNYGPPPSSGPA